MRTISVIGIIIEPVRPGFEEPDHKSSSAEAMRDPRNVTTASGAVVYSAASCSAI